MRGKYKKHAHARRTRQAEEAAQADRVQQAEYATRLADAEVRQAQAMAELAQLLPGLLEGMAAQTGIAQNRAELAEVKAENKRRWSALRGVYQTFVDDFATVGDPRYKISTNQPMLAENFLTALTAIRDEGDLHAGIEHGRDHPSTILRRHRETTGASNARPTGAGPDELDTLEVGQNRQL